MGGDRGFKTLVFSLCLLAYQPSVGLYQCLYVCLFVCKYIVLILRICLQRNLPSFRLVPAVPPVYSDIRPSLFVALHMTVCVCGELVL